MKRIEIIIERLQQNFSPEKLEVRDDSDKHKGHAGSRDGAGHYTVTIAAKKLAGKSRIESHRMIYAVLEDLIPKEIHALSINVIKETT